MARPVRPVRARPVSVRRVRARRETRASRQPTPWPLASGRGSESPTGLLASGPATAEDAWQWEGVPPGRGLIGLVEPGKVRYYMGDDGHGPCIKWLPPAWPPRRGRRAG